MDSVGCKQGVFSVSLYKYEDCSFFFLKWLEQEAHLLRSRQNTKDEELSYHGGKTRLMSLSGSINKKKVLVATKMFGLGKLHFQSPEVCNL